MKKFFLFFALSLCSLASWAQTNFDFNAEAPTGQTLYYKITSSTTVEVVIPTNSLTDWGDYSMPTGELTIPEQVDNYSVSSIGNNAFIYCSGLTKLTIPNSVTSIGVCAFMACSSLTDVTIGNSVTTIAYSAFASCSSLTALSIGRSMRCIERNAFVGCDNLTTLYYNAQNLTTTDEWINSDDYGFRPMPLQTLVIGNNVETLPNGVFYGQGSLTNVTIPNSVTSIGVEAFAYCANLTNLSIGRSMRRIERNAFVGCDNLTTLYYNAQNLATTDEWFGFSSDYDGYGFRPISLQTLVIGNNVETLPNGVFYRQGSLTNVTIPNSVTSIGVGAFAYCANLTNVTIPNSVNSIGVASFCDCTGLTSVSIGKSVTTIESSAFESCVNLSSLIIPNSVTSIGGRAFTFCNSLKYVVIGSSVTDIGSCAFQHCDSLYYVYNLSLLTIDVYSFINNYMYGTGYVKKAIGSISKYGSGDNTIYKLPRNIGSGVNDIPYEYIPINFFGTDGNGHYAREIVLTDDTSKFYAPDNFTAGRASYTREFANSNRSTLYLPFTAAVPEGFEVYDFTGFDNNTLTFSNHEGNIAAYTPYLVGYDLSKDGSTTKCTITQENAVFPKTATASPACTTTYNGMTFKGTMERKCMNSSNYGYRDGFFVQSADGSENDHSTHAHVNPFRAYFEFTSGNAPQNLPPTLNVELGYGDPVGIEAVETPEQEYDGRYGKDVYDMLGRLVRKNAESLEGLPRGIYLWKGKKHFVS